MAVYNGAAYLREAIDSILAQTFDDFEFIIVDDGSIDGTPEVLRSFTDSRIHIFRQDNQGPAAAANRGILEATSCYIARLDADDVANPDRLEKQVQFLENHPDFVLVGGFLEFITSDGRPIYVQTVPTSASDVRRLLEAGGNPFLHSAVMYRRGAALACGIYNATLRTGVDPDFLKRLARQGQATNLQFPVGKYRITPGAISNQTRRTLRKRAAILHKAQSEALNESDIQFINRISLPKSTSYARSLYAMRVGSAFLYKAGDARTARAYLWQAVKSCPSSALVWYKFILSLSPRAFRSFITRLRSLARL